MYPPSLAMPILGNYGRCTSKHRLFMCPRRPPRTQAERTQCMRIQTRRQYKTSKKKRGTYIYYSTNGTRVELLPGENGVTELDIAYLHNQDDTTFDEQARHEYHCPVHFDAYHDGDDDDASDRNELLCDPHPSPLEQLILDEAQKTVMRSRHCFRVASGELLPQQRELIQKIHYQKRTIASVAAEEGVTEGAIRDRLRKTYKRLRKYFEDRGYGYTDFFPYR
jgi:DNA-directed RNA polymerase specialized sigma subunit, sigma24 homolog